jgi:tetratricopeptide (TPR) repeat protein
VGPRAASAAHLLKEALPLLQLRGDREGVARAQRGLGWAAWNSGDGDEAERLFDAALEAVAEGPSSATQGQLMEEQARRRMLAGRHEEAMVLAGRALEIADTLGLTQVRIDCLISLGSIRGFTGESGGIAELERALELAREVEYGLGIMRAYKNLASHLFEVGNVDRALGLWAQAAAEAERFGDEFEIGWFAVGARDRAPRTGPRRRGRPPPDQLPAEGGGRPGALHGNGSPRDAGRDLPRARRY